MKGLMVSLVIVFFAGWTTTVLSAGQQDAAGFKPKLSLQPMAALERPGPDDSDDDVDWPTPISRLSQGSTNTSQTFGEQYSAPAPDSGLDNDVRFDVKVDQDAIAQLKLGKRVISPVEVRDQSTDAAMHPSVVSDIVLFWDANSSKENMEGVQLAPQPMEPDSKTLRFEIPVQQLDRIEQDAFVFNVPDNLRGKFDLVEFVAVSGPAGSHEFPSDLASGPRGSANGFGTRGTNGGFAANPRLSPNPVDRFSNASQNQRWNTTNAPQPGPEPGDARFNGPYIAPSERDLAPVNRNLNQQSDSFARRDQAFKPLDTSDRFRLAEPATPPQNNFRLPANNRNLTGRSQNDFLQNTNQSNSGQRFQETAAEQELRLTKQRLAAAEAEKKSLQQNASDWMRHSESLELKNVDLSRRLQTGSERVATRPLNTPPFNYVQPRVANPSNLNRQINTVGSSGYQQPGLGYRQLSAADLAQQKIEQQAEELNELKKQNNQLYRDNENANDLLSKTQNPLYSRTPASAGQLQLVSNEYRTDVQNPTPNPRPNRGIREYAEVPIERGDAGQNPRADRGNRDDITDRSQGRDGNSNSSASDALWLVALLLFSVGLNIFLWLHARTLYLRYDELADELRGMVGASTM